MITKSNSRCRGGFSLFEMLVVLSILGVVSTVGIGAFVSITSAYRTTEKRMDLEATAQRALDAIRDDLGMITPSRLAGTAMSGVRGMEEEHRYGRVPLENDRFVAPLSFHNPLEKRTERITVAYAIDRANGVPALVRTIQGGYGHELPAGATQVIAPGALSMRIAYFDGNQWLAEWKNSEHPLALRVSLTVHDLDRPYEQLSREATIQLQVR